MEAVEVPAGKKLYENKLIYKFSQITKTHNGIPGLTPRWTEYRGFYVHDKTGIVPHVSGRMFLTYSNQYVKVYEAQTGAVLQTLVEPAVDTSKPVDPKKGPRLSKDPLVSKADWSSDGQTLYVVRDYSLKESQQKLLRSLAQLPSTR